MTIATHGVAGPSPPHLPPGRWAVGVSGGADSVALLSLLLGSTEPSRLHVVHLNHQTRGGDSDDDERFVRDFCAVCNVPCTVARRDEIEPTGDPWPANRSARYRALRLALFRRTVQQHGLAGVALAHHADDQAETVFQRLVRGAGYLPLAAMSRDTTVGSLRIIRPLLHVRRQELRDYLCSIHQPWREDASNLSDQYARNRIRKLLAGDQTLTDSLLNLSRACAELKQWANDHAESLGATFAVGALRNRPLILAEASARRWLRERGCPVNELSDGVVQRLLDMVQDASTRPRQQFPGAVTVRRKQGSIETATARNKP